jgi:hypothetical protein
LIWIKPAKPRFLNKESSWGRRMLKTYTHVMHDEAGAKRFEPALHLRDHEAMAHARALLARHPDVRAIDVYLGDAQLFRVERP